MGSPPDTDRRLMMKQGAYLCIAALSCALALFSCSDEGTAGQEPVISGYELSFDVATRAAEAETGEEVQFRSLYIYAFDEEEGTTDFSKADFPESSYPENKCTIRMSVRKEGSKRFYVIANPPRYIKEQLTEECPEGRLKSLVIAMQGIAYSMDELPQNQDGVSEKNNTGFPMANVVTAYVRLADVANRKMVLQVSKNDALLITDIPVIRCLAKVTVKAYLDGHTTPVSVTGMSIYNFTGDGLFMPVWKAGTKDWGTVAIAGYAQWNTNGKQLDLTALEQQETQVITSATSVLKTSASVSDTYTNPNNALTLTSFYLCQNSYGEKALGDTMDGLEDTQGNRTTKLTVNLGDGRNSEFSLPYLRRNDHLTVYLKISKYAILFDFKIWNLVTVTPDWNEEQE